MIRNFLIIIIALSAVSISAADYIVNSVASSDTLFFRSSAKLEFIEGVTSDLIGQFSFDPQNMSENVNGLLRVDLRTLKTDIETRDGHMRDRHLHTEKFPYAYFQLEKIDNLPESIQTDSVYQVIGHGYFYIHGVKRELKPNLLFSYNENENIITVSASFEIELDKYKIPRPKALFLKLAKIIEIEVNFRGSTSVAVEPVQLPDWELIK